ncbi:S24 family peptidase [Pseudomonas sp.]|uniref:S24 family peptidase n=1 Tax=Pseudomonas sp. TaxID=306 RepID=UPI0026DBD1CB|nr:S24 family peptidase [Pseudomonas sp.]MDO4235408.1 S24 family peptidase [Pseudomonas sp.]
MKFDGFNQRLRQAIGSETIYSFAKKSGVSEPLLRKYLSGESVPSLEKAWKMAVTANVSLDWLAGKGAPHVIGQSSSTVSLNHNSQRLSVPPGDGAVKEFGGFSARLKKALGDETPHAFSNKCAIANSSLYSYLKGRVVPNIEKAWRMAVVANVSLDWLAGGGCKESQPDQNGAGSGNNDAYVYIPLYEPVLHGRKGPGSLSANVLTHLVFPADSLHKQKLCPQQLLAIPVMGDSMAGILNAGDIVLIDLERNQLDADALYVIRLNDQLYAKRLQRLSDGSACIINENKAYRDVLVTKAQVNDIDIMGRVIWTSSWM